MKMQSNIADTLALLNRHIDGTSEFQQGETNRSFLLCTNQKYRQF